MPTTLDEIMRAALTLAPDSRTILVERLMRSLEAQTDSVQAILESISVEQSVPDLTDDQKREIDRRISSYEANPEDVMTWDEVKASVRRR